MFRNAWPMAAVSGLFLCGGCSDQDRRFGPSPEGPLPPVGTLELHWTIDGAADAAACEAIGSTEFEAVVANWTQLEVPCSDFAAPLPLYEGDYVVRTRLVNARDYTVTRRVVLDRIRILGDQVTSLEIDFPSDYVAEPPEPEDAGTPPVDEPDAAPASDAGDSGPPLEEPTADAGVP
jgi:hypothetical protein